MRPWPEPGARKEEEAMKKLFALLMALTMTVQLVTPAWADAVEEGPEESTEAVEVVQETTEATEETEVPEETEAETKETEATEEVTEPESEAGEEAAAKVRVRFACTPEDLTLVVFPADGDVDQAIDAEEDGSYLLTAGEYGYLAEAEGYEAAEGRFTVTDEDSQVEVALAQADTVEEVEALAEGVVASGECGTGLTWVLTEDGTLTISGEGKMANYQYSGWGVAPWREYNPTRLVLNNGIISIGKYAFTECPIAGVLNIPDTVTSIGEHAFHGCDGLTGKLTLPSGLTAINEYTFYGCRNLLGKLVIPDGVVSIGRHALAGCGGLFGTLNFPASLESIGYGAFEDCSGFKGELVIPETITEVGESAFSGCTGFSGFVLPKNMTKIPNCLFMGWKQLTGDLIIPDRITEIGDGAFSGCSGLTDVKLPAFLKKLGDSAFFNCTGLSGELALPQGLETIGNSAFQWCHALSGNLVIPDSVTTLGMNAFNGCYHITGELALSNGLQVIDNNAFDSCGATILRLPKELIQIRANAFNSCKFLNIFYPGTAEEWTNVDIRSGNDILTKARMHYTQSSGTCDDGLSWNIDKDGILIISGSGKMADYTIENPAIWCDQKFTGLVIEEGISGIGAYAFYGYGTLKGIPELPSTLETVGEGAFHGCTPDYFYFHGTKAQWEQVQVGQDNESLQRIHFLTHSTVCVEENSATCTEAGSSQYYRCEVCGKLFRDEAGTEEITLEDTVLAPLGHTMVKTEAKAPTDTENGNNAYYTCETCHKVFKDEEGKQETTVEDETLPTLEKHELVKVEAKDPSCTETGNRVYYTCNLCDKLYRDETAKFQTTLEAVTIAPLGHTMEKTEAVEPTYRTTGNNAYYTCKRCGKVYKDEAGQTETTVEDEVLAVLPSIALGDCGKNLTWVLTEDGTLIVSGNGWMPDFGSSNTAPWHQYRTNIYKVVLETGVTSIGDYAFYSCYRMKEIYIPEGVTQIGQFVFQDCEKLEKATLPSTVSRIGQHAFYNCGGLQEMRIPEGVTQIDSRLFSGCTNLKSVKLPDSITSISYDAFYNCSNLTELVLPAKLKEIGSDAFSGCKGLTKLKIPEMVISIGQGAFHGCSGLTSITIPDGVAQIGQNAFSGCSGLTSVNIPKGLVRINSGTFSNCSGLIEVVIPNGVLSIESSAFSGCSGLESVSIPDSVTSIGWDAFSGCSGLTNVTIPNSVTSIGSSAFENCTSLTSIKIPDSVTSIGAGAFSGCTVLTGATILGKITELKQKTFYNCTSLESVTLPDGLFEIGGLTPGGSGYGAFENCSSLKEIVIPDSVTSIAPRAFENCSSLLSIRIPDGVTVIDCATFSNCTSLESVTLPAKLQKMGRSHYVGTFEGCTALKSVTIPDGTEIIDHGVFWGCSSLDSVSIPQSVTKLGDSAFFGCSNLKDVYYSGDEVAWKQIEVGSSNESLTSAYIHYGLTHICTTHLIPAVIPTCTTVGNNAYYLCDACGRVYKDEQNREQTTVEAETLSALGHAMTLTEAKAATCTEDGNNAYYTCGNCHKVFKDEQGEKKTTAQAEILPALGHSISIVNTVAPTCTEKGNRLYYTCATCGKAFKDKAGLEATTVAAETVPALGHTMIKTEAVAPTCTEKGTNAYYTCETCEKVFKDALGKQETAVEAEVLEALGHTMVLTEAKASTCTETGNNLYYTCKTCRKVFKDEMGREETTVKDETLAALGHTMTKTEAVAPSCTESGNNAYYTCETCHKVYKDETGKQETTAQAEILKALGHAMTRTEPKAPTCTTAGTNGYYTCGTCHKVFKDQQGTQETTVAAEVLKALGHSMVKTEAKAPTCTESGNNAYYTCQTCHGVFKDEAGKQATTVSAEQLAAFGHSMARTAAKEATCTTDGNHTYYTCRTCGKVYKDLQGTEETTVKAEIIAALGHTMERTNALAPTCTESGNTTYYTCATCQKVFKDQQGKQETTVKAETIPALGHTMVKTEAVAPTCTESGNNAYYTCKTCRKVFKDEMGQEETTVQDETLAALGHTMTKTEAVAPSCTEKGNNAYYTCTTCHKVFKDEAGKRLTTVSAETLAAFGHSMVKTAAKEATCTETGNTTYYTCKTCGKVYKDEAGQEETTIKAETIPALGHTMVKTEAVAPTCTESGNNAYYTCETCHKVYKDETGKQETTAQAEILKALGHDMDKTEAVAPTHTSGGSNAYYTCKTCHKVFADEQGTTETTPEQERLPRLPGMADGKCGSLTWFISDEGKLTISGKGRMPDYSGSALAPWYDYREKILALEVEEGVLSLGDYAFFDCENLKTIQLPKSLTKLGKSCFVGCDGLALLDLTQLPKELTQKVTDLTGLAVLPETLSKLAGSKASFQWRLETIEGQPAAKNLAKLDGSQLTVLRSGAFRLVCLEEYTGLEASIQAAAQTTTVIRPEEREQLTSGEKLELSAWAMPFETELTADWTVTEESQAYATVTKDGVLTAKSITKPVQVTVRAVPKNGEDPAEKSIWLLPKTIGMGILVNGHLVGDSLTAELTEAELNLIAQIQPQGAKTEVTWTSSREDVAEISAAGTVKLLKPGITLIRAQSTDGSGVSAELTLKVQYLDGAEKLTLTADADAAVLELGRTAQLTLSGEDTIDPEHVEFQITQGSAAAVDAQGLLTAGNVPGKVTIVAALKDDPLQRRAQLTVEIVPVLIRALTLEPQVSQEWGYAEEASGESWVYGEIAFVVNQNRTFQINAQGKDYREAWNQVTNLTYESSDPAVAQVDAKGLVTLTAKEAGTCAITVRCTDNLGTETRLHIVLQDSAPRLESTKVTLNSNLIAGVTTGLAESYNNTIQSVTLYDYDKTTKRYEEAPSDSFAAEAEDGTLTIRALGAQKNGTYQLKLVVDCLGGSYDYILQVKVANSLPKVTVKQIGKFDTFYLDSTAQLTATAAGCQVERLKLIGADSFRMDEDGNLFYAESYNPGDKIVTKGTLLIYVEGYQVPVEKSVTIATTKTAPKLTLNPSASAVNRALEDPEFRVKVLWKGNALDLTDADVTPDVGFAAVEAQGQYLVFRLTGTTGGTAKLSLRLPGWAQAVSLTHKITVDTKLPTVKLGVTTLKLNSLFSAQTAETSVWLTQGNLDISTMDFKAAREEGNCIDLSFDPETDSIEAKFNPEIPKPKAGTYSYTYTAYLENGTALPNGTIKVTVAATAPKVKLSAASVKLNRYLAGQEKATVKVTLTGGTGYQVTDFEGLPDYMRYDAETSELTVVLPDENFTGETRNLCPIVREEESGQEVPLPTKLTLKIQTLNTNKLTVSLSAKGKLNTVDPDSAIAYTVTKVNNCLGTVESVDLIGVGEDAERFQADLDTSGVKPVVLLRLLPGESYATNKTYKVQFCFTVCGTEVRSSVLSVKVTQTALKVTAPKTAVYYLSQSGPLRCSLKASLPLESVALSTRTAKEFQQALGGEENLGLIGNRVEFRLTNPSALKAGKSYSVQLELTPENAAENTKPTIVKLTVKVMK